MPNDPLTLLEIVAARTSHPSVTSEAPSHEQLLPLVAAASRMADHGALRPWRLIEVRGAARARLGEAISRARGESEPSAKPLRAPLLIAIVVVVKADRKVQAWEQEAAAAGVAHTLSLLLESEGWGTMWRSGDYTRSPEVHTVHGLADNEQLLGWLYVGGIDPDRRSGPVKRPVEPEEFLSTL